MKIAVFTSNQPRHLALIETLSGVADEVVAVLECNTVFPGKVEDFFRKSDIMQRYFGAVIAAEERVFGKPRFVASNARILALRMGDLSGMDTGELAPALDADYTIVFGASYIRGDLCDRLIAQRAVNIHMGISPYYRGSSCNFWALHDGRPDLVGATIHMLSKGLDSGAILFHAFPRPDAIDPFDLGMQAVRAAQQGLVKRIADGDLFTGEAIGQDAALELRYSRNAEFNDEVAGDYLARLPSPEAIHAAVSERPADFGIRPFIA
jgi:hypothetical protein